MLKDSYLEFISVMKFLWASLIPFIVAVAFSLLIFIVIIKFVLSLF